MQGSDDLSQNVYPGFRLGTLGSSNVPILPQQTCLLGHLPVEHPLALRKPAGQPWSDPPGNPWVPEIAQNAPGRRSQGDQLALLPGQSERKTMFLFQNPDQRPHLMGRLAECTRHGLSAALTRGALLTGQVNLMSK
jgi:hypothetical protein